jgi:hypothetical protein
MFEAARAVIENDERVLVCAFENSIVDQTIRNIARLLQSRYGWSDDVIARSVKRTGFIARAAPVFSDNHMLITTRL